jgi:hypothetical protein
VNAVKAASRADFDSLSWLPVSVADNVWSALHPDDAGSESGNAIAGGRDEGSSSDGSGGDGVGGDAAGRNGGRVT